MRTNPRIEEYAKVRPQDVEKAITCLVPTARVKNSKSSNQDKTKYYDGNGRVLSKNKDAQSCAISITVNDKQKIFRVKTGRGGHFYNPLKEGDNYSLNGEDKTTNKSIFRWKEVSEKTFNMYLKFLETKYDSYLLSAEREG